jgi:hypothetical protein
MNELAKQTNGLEKAKMEQTAQSPLGMLGIAEPDFRPEGPDVPKPDRLALLRLIYKPLLPESEQLSDKDETRLRYLTVAFRTWCSLQSDVMSAEYIRTAGMFDSLPEELRAVGV